MMKNEKIKILHLEDSEIDVELIGRVLKKGGLEFETVVVDTRSDYIRALGEFSPDLVLSDHSLPSFNSLQALGILKASGSLAPFILVTGAVSEEFAAQITREGADDYILKDRPERLPKAVLNALEKYHLISEKQKSDTHLKNFFEHSIDIMCTIDADGKFIDVSEASELIWGYKPHELVGKKYSAFILEEDHLKTKWMTADVIAGMKTTNFENRFICKNGKTVYVVWSACWDKETKIMYCVARDGTEKKLAEEKIRTSEANLAAIIENTGASVYSIDTQFRYVAFNGVLKDTMKTIYGIDIKPGDSVFAFLETTNQQEALWWEKTYTTALTGTALQFVKDYSTPGAPIFFHFSINPIWANNRVIGLSCMARDVTPTKKLEAELVVLNEGLEQKIKERTAALEIANHELESFNYTVSHDLQAPLRVVSGFSKLMLKNYSDKLDAAGNEQLQVINKMVHRMSQLVKDLLAFSRGGKAIIKKAEVNMNDLVRTVADEIKIANPDIKYALVIQNLPLAFCDQGLVTQVWTNLISNAAKYSKNNKHAVIEVGSDIINGQQTYYVKDNGAGFDMQHAEKLFAAFQRLHRQEDFEGTGVGLATVHRIITGHGGHIWAEAKVNEGATFYFSIPPRTT